MSTIIKINWLKDTSNYNGTRKLKNTNLPLGGIYEDEEGNVYYYKNGKLHNENEPAYIRKDGYKAFCINGKIHRIDGPAIIYSNGKHYWYINDYEIDEGIMNNWLTENDIPLDWNTWTVSDKMLFALHWNDYNG